MDDLIEADWVLGNGTVSLRPPGGGTITPTALEVVGAEFKARRSVRGHEVRRRPSESLPGIRFCRFPGEVILKVTPPSSDLSVSACCQVQLVHEGVAVTVVDLELPSEHLVVNNTWIPIEPASRLEVTRRLHSAGVKETGSIGLGSYLKLRSRPCASISFDVPPQPIALSPSDASSSIPDFYARLYPYQAEGVAWLRRVAQEGVGCILADEMGLGKTIQVIALLAAETSSGRRPSIIIAPATLLENWRREIRRFAPKLHCHVHRGAGRTGFPSSLRTHEVVLTTYDTCIRDLPLLRRVDWHLVVLDEAQAIKSPDAQRTRSVKALPRAIAIAMTGTPVENRLKDIWSLLDFAAPGFLGDLSTFESNFDDTIESAARLEPIVSPLMLRRRVAQVATDLPPRINVPQAIDLAPSRALEYERIRQRIVDEYGAAATLVAITALRLYCTHPFLVTKDTGNPAEWSTKYERLVEILEEIGDRDEKVLIFTSFTEMSDLLLHDLPDRLRVPCLAIDGRTPVEERQDRVDAFQGLSGSGVLLLNPKAAGTGLNITAANHVVHYNLEWNPAVEDQATARAYRRGQARPVVVHRLFHANTIEEVIDDRVSRKRELSEQAVVGVTGAQDDLADLVRAIELSPVRLGDQS